MVEDMPTEPVPAGVAAYCTNTDCSENDIAKDMSGLEFLPDEITCGACRGVCAVRTAS